MEGKRTWAAIPTCPQTRQQPEAYEEFPVEVYLSRLRSLAHSLLLPQGKFEQLYYFADKSENRPKLPFHAGVK